MKYKQLYEHCQTLTPHVGRNAIKAAVCSITGEDVQIIEVGLDPAHVRGFFVSASSGHQFVAQCRGRNVVVIAREMNRCWKRFVIFKELMHLLDPELSYTSTAEEFGDLLEEFAAPGLDRSPQMAAEVYALWMATALFCPETLRQELQRQFEAGTISTHDVATKLLMPEQYVPRLFNPNYKAIMSRLLAAPRNGH